MDKDLFHQLAEQVEREWDVGGLADGIDDGFYERFAFEVASRYCANLEKMLERAMIELLVYGEEYVRTANGLKEELDWYLARLEKREAPKIT